MTALTSRDVSNWLNIVLSETGEQARVKEVEARPSSVIMRCTEPFNNLEKVYQAISRQSVNARITVRKQYVMFSRKPETGQACNYGGDW